MFLDRMTIIRSIMHVNHKRKRMGNTGENPELSCNRMGKRSSVTSLTKSCLFEELSRSAMKFLISHKSKRYILLLCAKTCEVWVGYLWLLFSVAKEWSNSYLEVFYFLEIRNRVVIGCQDHTDPR